MAKNTTWANRRLLPYAIALAVTVAASVWRDVMVRSLGDTLPLYITFYPVVMIVSLVFGLRQALLAILYSVLLVAYWNLPREGAGIPDLADVIGMVLFAGMCVGMAVVAEQHRRTRERAAAYETQLAVQSTLKRAAEEIREQAALLEMAPAGIFARDLNSRIAYWGRGAEELYGWSKQEALGKATHELFDAQYPQPVAEIENAVKRGRRWEGELMHVTRSGKRITVASRWAPQYDDEGQAIGFLEINVDVSERKRVEAELKRYVAELARSNAELQDFASIASHDLQEPLRKVIAFGDHLKEHSGDKLDELGLDYLARMQNAAQRMSGLIDALLEYSRVATQAQPFQPVDMLAVVFGVVVDLEERIAKSHARIEVAAVPKVMADPMQARQLIQNLVANALKFHPTGARPHVEIEGKVNSRGWCEISVRDNGIGFEEKYLDRIFRPFQRLHGRSEYEGSGMGLAICRKVVARHGGTITAHSRPGEGSTFVVTLPAVKITDGEGRQSWETEMEPSRFESCSPKTMTTIST